MPFWTAAHLKIQLPLMVLMVIVAWVLRRVLKNKKEHVRMIPFQIVAAVIAVLEIVKQVKSLSDGYDLWHLPLHVCSIITFLLRSLSAVVTGCSRRIHGRTDCPDAGLS